MHSKEDSSNFIRFLKDEKFIEWKLFPTDELINYWEEYIIQHPEEKIDISLAEKHFNSIDISSINVSQQNRIEVGKRIKQSLSVYNRKKTIYRVVYTSAACIAIFLISIIFFKYGLGKSNQNYNEPIYIVGNELESEDILFVTGAQTKSFQKNIDIKIENNKTAQIIREGEETKDEVIDIEQHTINKLIVPHGKRSKISLPDGTQVWINSGSTLEFPSSFPRDKREIYIAGEIYIEVAPDKKKPFFVHTNNYDVRVYGTKFNVSSYSESLSSVVLVEGSVGLQSANKEDVILMPSEQAVYIGETDTFKKQKVDANSLISWKEGYLSFNDTPITDALKLIGRYYNLSFNLDDNVTFKGLTCTGKIILSDNLDNVMMALSLISGTEYKKQDKQIFIYETNN